MRREDRFVSEPQARIDPTFLLKSAHNGTFGNLAQKRSGRFRRDRVRFGRYCRSGPTNLFWVAHAGAACLCGAAIGNLSCDVAGH